MRAIISWVSCDECKAWAGFRSHSGFWCHGRFLMTPNEDQNRTSGPALSGVEGTLAPTQEKAPPLFLEAPLPALLILFTGPGRCAFCDRSRARCGFAGGSPGGVRLESACRRWLR